MKKVLYLITAVALTIQSCQGQNANRKFHSDIFQWTITVPENFVERPAKEIKTMLNTAKKLLEKSSNQKYADDDVVPLCSFGNGQYNYFVASYSLYDSVSANAYAEIQRSDNNLLYNTLKQQAPNITVDSSSSLVLINGLRFYNFIIQFTNSNSVTVSVISYKKLFVDKSFEFTCMFIDKDKGDLILSAWKKSTFSQ